MKSPVKRVPDVEVKLHFCDIVLGQLVVKTHGVLFDHIRMRTPSPVTIRPYLPTFMQPCHICARAMKD